MKIYKLKTSLTENGTLLLKDLPFQVGDSVEVIILESHSLTSENHSQSYRYDDPFESATPLEDWEVL